jgi:hypothetical protein
MTTFKTVKTMKKNFYTARVMGACFLWATLLGAGSVLTSCSDDDDDLTQLSSPTGSEATDVTATSLTFTWNKMSNVIQYGYTLKNANGEALVTDVTTAHTATFTGLQPGHTYTLEVTAYAAVGSEYSNSQPLVLTGTTLSFLQLDTPVVTAEAAARSVISWNQVDNATEYTYSYELNGTPVSVTTTDTSFTLDFLPIDEAVTVSVVASSPASELYHPSDAGTVTVTRTRTQSAKITAELIDGYTYEQLGEQRTLTSYSDGSYVISDWYGTSGYDLEFIVPDANTGEPVFNATYDSGWWALIASADETVWAYTSGYYGALYGDMNEGGFYFWNNNTNSSYYLEWKPKTDWPGTWTNGDTVVSATIHLNEDGSYTLPGWYGYEGYDFHFTLDGNNYIVLSSDEYYYDSGTWYWWIPTGPTDNDGTWIYVAGGFGQWDNTGIWFYDYGLGAYYWFKISE